MTDFISLKIDTGLRLQIEDVAKKNKRSRSDMVRIMLSDWLDLNKVEVIRSVGR